jgi:Zn-finger in ubiquitin-hydrolases and other protein
MLPILICPVDTTLLQEKAYEFTQAHSKVLAKPFDVDLFVDTVRAMLATQWLHNRCVTDHKNGMSHPGSRVRRFSLSILRDPSLDEYLTPEHVRDVQPSALGCEDCLKIGGRWVHLRICTECGHVGCCDNSPNRHATKHFHATQHPIIRSFEPDEK